MIQYALFETAIGWTGLVWGDRGLVGVYLPEREIEAARRGLLRKFPEAAEAPASEALQPAIEGIRALMRGEKADLSAVALQIDRVPEFNARVYEIARAIPPGETLTYGEIAVRLGDRLLARDVGAALGQNPWPIVVPCHRVTAAGGKLGGFSAGRGQHQAEALGPRGRAGRRSVGSVWRLDRLSKRHCRSSPIRDISGPLGLQ